MTVSRSIPPVSSESAVSRRTVLGVTVTGAAITLLSRGVEAVSAQESTPAAEGGMPPGVGVQPLITVPLKDLPTSPVNRSEEHTSELQSRGHLVCRLLLEKKKNI